MDSCPRVWNLLHDGTIVGISGSVPGTLVLEVEIEYLRTRFAEPGDKIVLTLLGCSQFVYKPWEPPDELITSLTEIAAKELEILSADLGPERCMVHCTAGFGEGGTLEIASDQVDVALDQGRIIALDELESVVESYWIEWEAENHERKEKESLG